MKTTLTVTMQSGNVDMKVLTVQCDSPARAREVLGYMIAGSIGVPEVSDAYTEQMVRPQREVKILEVEV
jgi:hypothetical protein